MRHYACMSPEQCAAIPVGSVASDDCWLFLWMTGPFLVQGAHLTILRGWGFKPSSIGFVWEKRSFGTGFTTRQSCEFVVIGRRGRPGRLSASVRQFLSEPRREHSRKPTAIHARIEEFCAGPRLELFGRESRVGWRVWGDQATLFDEAP